MQPPSVLIAANPYEAELCRRALVETGLRVVEVDGGEGALDAVRAEKPLVLVVALGIIGADPLELMRTARAEQPTLAIFLIADREGEVPDEDAAIRLGAMRLFLRPIDIEAFADAIEKRAVEAEVASDVAEAMREFDVRPPTIDAAPLVEESIVEMEADYGDDDEEKPAEMLALARIALKRVPREVTEVMKGVIEVAAPQHRETRTDEGKVEATLEMDADEPTPLPGPLPTATPAVPATGALSAGADSEASPPPDSGPATTVPVAPIELPPPSVAVPEPLLRADDALADAGIQSLVVTPDFVERRRIPESLKRAETLERGARPSTFDERSTFARRLESELSAAERRLFPDSPSTASGVRDEYEDALGDIDLDSLGIDTIPGIGADALDAALEMTPRNGHAAGGNGAAADRVSLSESRAGTSRPEPSLPESALADSSRPRPSRTEPSHATAPPAPALPDDDGELTTTDVATLFATLHAAGFTGALSLLRGDGDKTIYFDAGMPVAARSTFSHDRLPDLLAREGVIGKEQLVRARAAGDGGRGAAQKLVELGIIKSSELFATVRHHAEEIVYSCFGWERGRYRLSHEQPPTEDRVRLGHHPWALFVEGVRRKYNMERLVELIGPPETVLTPTTTLASALEDGHFTAAERARAELIDGERSLSELQLAVVGQPLPESGLYALAWALVAIGAARLGDESSGESRSGIGLGVRSVPTLVTPPYGAERRTRARAHERPRDRDADRAIDKERVLAKRAQVLDGDYFVILGLDRDASAHEVARAFERLKREFALDRFADPVRSELAEALVEISQVLDEAHRVLCDDAVRMSYRAHLPPA
ncbi:MAG: response regulator receiver protein [Myxococcales bacterium]|nr:response regulator receiver protein [Myxococcales bacterium]